MQKGRDIKRKKGQGGSGEKTARGDQRNRGKKGQVAGRRKKQKTKKNRNSENERKRGTGNWKKRKREKEQENKKY